ncbi:hypothetical protein NUU61_007930 [Penicillium alfredii]|uniref:tRNA (guanine-N(7)-)-methyltransferase n=1 Tax=Penicillium alfredii TaxID=1506179 RepID=A0A9W9JYT0_9EURO|nr:uncharacterized protein NUU61_007930 [Penicillium alfredii]KAJ5086623.1 hypothetical protein NUU61_007930 [Penicillium alfredii]
MATPPPSKRQKREEYRRKIQSEHGTSVKMPQKKFFRQRAHANPFSDHQLDYPLSPAHMDWSLHYPAFVNPNPSATNLAGARKLVKDVEVVDIGCGFGGLMVGLAPLLPETLMVGEYIVSRHLHISEYKNAKGRTTGMEIRTQVLEYLHSRIQALRTQQQNLKQKASNPQDTAEASTQSKDTNEPAAAAASALEDNKNTENNDDEPALTTIMPGNYENITAIRSNTMKFLPNFFGRHQLSKIFICFPDPHFKARKHKARIISESLNAEYAYVLRPSGLLYTITDVEEYHHWILRHFHFQSDDEAEAQSTGQTVSSHAPGIKDLWERVSDAELEADPCVRVMKFETEESKKVSRNNGNKYVAVFRRKADPEWPA